MSQVFDPHCLGSINGRNVYSEEYVNGLAEQVVKYLDEVQRLWSESQKLLTRIEILSGACALALAEITALPQDQRPDVVIAALRKALQGE
jgi:hypothetical protein